MHNLGYNVVPQEVLMKSEVLSLDLLVSSLVAVDELQKSLLEMKNLNGPDFEEKMGNVMTWVSAALTDEDTCMDGFQENSAMNSKVKATIRNYIVNVAQLTSNALALTKNLSSS